MKTPLSSRNSVPARCFCWMARGEDQPYREVCEAFSPNPFATIAVSGVSRALCHDCEHPERCHSGREAE